MGFLLKLLGGNLIAGVKGIITSIWGDKEKRDEYDHESNMSAQESYQSEFEAPEKHNPINIAVDAINRLVRPTFTYGILGLFVWDAFDPVTFTLSMQSLGVIPPNMWYIMGAVIGFWFAGRTLETLTAAGSVPTKDALNKVLNAKAQIQQLKDEKQTQIDAKNMSEDKFQAEMKDTSVPLSNAAILKWNQKNGNL